jgi:hypothetical protein
MKTSNQTIWTYNRMYKWEALQPTTIWLLLSVNTELHQLIQTKYTSTLDISSGSYGSMSQHLHMNHG